MIKHMGFSFSDVQKMTREDRTAFYNLYKKEQDLIQEIREDIKNSSK
tara:strand:- start:1224 stop:1364 length:141 start_codon:yes stop_codon:yes gene_type:complete